MLLGVVVGDDRETKEVGAGGGNLVCNSTLSSISYFKGAKKGTPFAAQTAAEKAALDALSTGMKNVEILIKGQGSGRETAIRAIEGAGFEILSINDITPVPHNGCRPPKRRRV